MTGAFQSFHQQNRPLSFYLQQRYAEPARTVIAALSLDDLTDADAVVSRLVAEHRVPPPALGEPRRGPRRDGLARPAEEAGVRTQMVRQWLRFPVDGDVEALDHWPDRPDGAPDLRPVDDDLAATSDPPPGAPYDPAAARRRHDALIATELWIVAGPGNTQREPGLHTFVELSREEMAAVGRGELELAPWVAASQEQVAPIIAAIAEQHRRFFEDELPEQLLQAVEARRALLHDWAAVESSLGFPAEWKAVEPELAEADQREIEDNSARTVEPEVGTQLRGTGGDGNAGEQELRLPGDGPARLADASFTDVLQTVRVWADAIERYPEAFRALNENRISDLLVATLNAALPGAGREVYSRGGKTDIFIRANALPLGNSPAMVFIGESKKWSGPADADTGLTQLLGYLDVRDTASLLLLLVESQGFQRAHESAINQFTRRPDFFDRQEDLAGWPVLTFGDTERAVRVCVATVDISAPPPHPQTARRRPN